MPSTKFSQIFSLFFFFLLLLLVLSHESAATEDSANFTFNGFGTADLTLDGLAVVEPGGLLRLVNTTKQSKGHAFFPTPLRFRRPSSLTGTVSSFSAAFVFAIVPEVPDVAAHGLAFVLSPTKNLPSDREPRYLGLLNSTNNGNSSNHLVAVEFDIIRNTEFNDTNDNHVGIDINSLQSNVSMQAMYYQHRKFENMSLISGEPIQAWVEFHSEKMKLDVTVSPLNVSKPAVPLLSLRTNLSDVILDTMYVGFSAATGKAPTSFYVLGWSFKMNGTAPPLDLLNLPKLPTPTTPKGNPTLALMISLPFVTAAVLLTVIGAVAYALRQRAKYAEVLEDWEEEYGPHRFSYMELFKATKGFKDQELLGSGGFGTVYRGVLPASKNEVAVKRVSHESKQGVREFVAEVVSLGRLRHRNLVQLLGYCRRKGELLLVYDFMPNGSLDKFLFDGAQPTLDWDRRFRIIKGVASGLLYLHEGWEQVIIHRDVKASNVLLDGELNGRLGDFGLARLYDHGTASHTTHVVGTMGYLAPELSVTGKATKPADVFAFGVFLLEVVSARRPIDPGAESEEVVLLHRVMKNWVEGDLLRSADPRVLAGKHETEEVELVLKLGLLCSHPSPDSRPTMRQAVQILEGDMPLPAELSPLYWNASVHSMIKSDVGFDEFINTYPSSSTATYSSAFLSGGR